MAGNLSLSGASATCTMRLADGKEPLGTTLSSRHKQANLANVLLDHGASSRREPVLQTASDAANSASIEEDCVQSVDGSSCQPTISFRCPEQYTLPLSSSTAIENTLSPSGTETAYALSTSLSGSLAMP